MSEPQITYRISSADPGTLSGGRSTFFGRSHHPGAQTRSHGLYIVLGGEISNVSGGKVQYPYPLLMPVSTTLCMYSYVDNTYFDTNTKGSFEDWFDVVNAHAIVPNLRSRIYIQIAVVINDQA